MSILRTDYLDHLREQLDEDDDDDDDALTAFSSAADSQFYDDAFEQAVQKSEQAKLPKPTAVPPGKAKVAVFRARFQKHLAIFNPADDLRWDQVQVSREVTQRDPRNGNVLQEELVLSRPAIEEVDEDEARDEVLADKYARWSARMKRRE